MRPPTTVVAVLVGLAVLVGCGGNPDRGGVVRPEPSSATVPMETAVLDLVTMRKEMFARLDARFGTRQWTIDGNDLAGIGRAGCDAVGHADDGEIALLPNMGIVGSYPHATWKRAAAIVEQVGRAHGFTDVSVTVDEPGNFEIDGRDATGAQYVFGQGGNTGLLITSGCHVWATPPPDGRRAREPEVG